ncbi:inorganic phosphate transporter [Lacrimispora sp. 210928-DFI.3.58]|uniref:inorganic phosphate transporter n=1 Tax=Lacrimispora sp. 210928-DFI.3.58 TaxID=2883214 RepID=UPI001D072152|nr:inorganic phosphate transporter [Lacrimispora sp. 210928-DFI.3.58]MCB7321324.1 inorganic phosphate transporter [Lacrimispora sp. 210928-DFI.3.58]
MDMSLPFFMRQVVTNPALLITVVLTLGVICVNGITDAPNAIATCVSTRSLDVNIAIVMAAVCNCGGIVFMTMVNSTVAMTITNMVDFGDDSSVALVALCAALVSIVVWSIFCWYSGCPTSESHSLIAGLTGAAIAIRGGFSAINVAEWMKVVYGLVLSVTLGFSSGFLSCRIVAWICRNMDRRKTDGFFKYAQIAGAAAMAFMHGAQDGQKFMGVLLLGICMVNGSSNTSGVRFPLWMLLLSSAAMALGTSIGGKKIIKSVGMDMVRLEKYQGFSADIAGAACLLFFSLFGIPVSTTHTKTTSIMGVGAVKRLSAINFGVVKDMAMTWVMCFPGCGLIGFCMAKLFMMVIHG